MIKLMEVIVKIQMMKKWMSDKEETEDEFMKSLSDDIYVAYRSLSSEYGEMFVSARQSSQGTQRAYNVRNLSSMNIPPPGMLGMTRMMRGGGAADDDCDSASSPPIPDNVGLSHQMSDQTTTPFAGMSQIKMMRSISSPTSPTRTKDIDTDK